MKPNQTLRNKLTLALTAAVVAITLPASALACGGFFCFTQPIDQSAERILYVMQDGQVQVHIQISYTGEDEKFSWLLPLTSKPETGIGSDTVFAILEQLTAPQFILDWQYKKDCYAGGRCMAASADGGNGVPGSKGGGVEVLEQKQVGPYEQVVLKGNNGEEIFKWLNDNGYIQPEESKVLIDVYAKEGYVFMALKLQKDKSTGDLAPIVVTVDEDSPCLPLRLTRIAAAADMPIVAWVLGKSRAIPKNFLHVEVNEATIDWLRPGNNYKSVVNTAVDQASGHAFTTEYAQPTKNGKCYGQSNPNCWKNQFWRPQWDASALKKLSDAGAFLAEMMNQGLPRSAQMQALIRKYIPKPANYQSVPDNSFYNCLQCQSSQCWPQECAAWKSAVKLQPFDHIAFATTIDEQVIAPMKALQTEFDADRYLTRLYTTVSPPEMNKDPIFAFNKDLPDVDNVHRAKAEPICKPGVNEAHKVILTLASGQEVTLDVPDNAGPCWASGFNSAVGFGQGGDAFPIKSGGKAAKKVEVMDESGAPLEIDPKDADRVDAELNKAQAGTPSLSEEFKASLKASTWDYTKVDDPANGDTGTGATSDSGGCTAAPVSSTPWGLALVALLGLGALGLRRRRLPLEG